MTDRGLWWLGQGFRVVAAVTRVMPDWALAASAFLATVVWEMRWPIAALIGLSILVVLL